MGTYALSAGYYDAYYKRAQQVNIVLCLTCAQRLYVNKQLVNGRLTTPPCSLPHTGAHAGAARDGGSPAAI